jgi:hypothetical protein
VYITLLRGSSGNVRLKQVAQYPSYLNEPLRLSIQFIQLGHLAPPPCAIHLSVLPMALALQSGSTHLAPPPCATHLSVLPMALALQSGSIHLAPPPCAIHLSVLPWALALQSGSVYI